MNFDEAFEAVLGHEGGYVNNPKDPGGETRFGISKRAYPAVDIRNLTLDQAKVIYRRDYWAPLRLDDLPAAIRFDVFDAAVNSGLAGAIRLVQAAAKVTVDGRFGPATLAAVQAMDPVVFSARMNGARLAFMTNLNTWDAFAKGWARRIAGNLMRL